MLSRVGDKVDFGNFGGAVFVLEFVTQQAPVPQPARV